MKKVNGLTNGMENTHEMCQKIELHDTEPDNDLPEYIPYSEIHDKDTDEETKFVVIFATKPTLSTKKEKTRKFHGCFSVSAHDEKETWIKVYTFNFCCT